MLSSTLSTALRTKARTSRPVSSTSRKPKSFCTGSRGSRDSSRGGQGAYEEDEEGDREIPGVPEKTRGDRSVPKQMQHRSTVSILSPLNRTAVGLGGSGVIVFSGQLSLGHRYCSWPRADTCKIRPPGASKPLDKPVSEGSVTGMISEGLARAQDYASGRGKENYLVYNKARGLADWKVSVGDELFPKAPLLTVGPVNFFQQPAYKNRETPRLFVAKLLLNGLVEGDILPGTPLLVAVYDPTHLPRFEDYVPSREQMRVLGSDYRGFL